MQSRLSVPEVIENGMGAVALATVIDTIPPEDRSEDMADLVEWTRALVRLQLAHRGGAEGEEPARQTDLHENLVAIYPAVFKKVRAYWEGPDHNASGSIGGAVETFLQVFPEHRSLLEEPSIEAAAAPTLKEGSTQKIPIEWIRVGRDRRARADKRHVAELAASIAATGLQNAIVVGTSCDLVSGLHRLLAHEQLGLKEILVHVLRLEERHARLAEIDENLVRRQLPALELAELTYERKQIYEVLHPETKQHVRGGYMKRSQKLRAATARNAVADSFAADTARKAGIAERTVRQQTQVAKGLAPSVKDRIRNTPIASRIGELVALSRLPAAEQIAVATIIEAGKAKRVSQALGQFQAQKPSGTNYMASQVPIIQQQRAVLERLVEKLQATAAEWAKHDAVAMSSFITFNRGIARWLEKTLSEAGSQLP